MKSGKATHKATTNAKAKSPAVPQVWGHRFREPLNSELAGFLASIGFDHELAMADIAGSIAHATMLGQRGIISKDDASVLVAGLRRVWSELSSGRVKPSVEHEDIHMNVEALLSKRIGDKAGLLHAGRSRNDQVALDLRLYVREHIAMTLSGLVSLQETLLGLARSSLSSKAIIQGHTHLQPAQPVLAAHVFLAYVEKFQRDIERLEDAFERVNLSPLGAGALAGTGLDTDPKLVADMLGMGHTFSNSLDAVSDRDFVFETVSDLSLVAIHLSSLCEELIFWCSGEVGWATIGDAASTGSSMMPQKKNPDVFELVRGKTGRVLGHLSALGITLKGLPLAYNKDLQEDKEPTFDAFKTVESCLGATVIALKNLSLCPKKMNASITAGVYATDLAEYLVKKGLPFRESHGTVGKLVLWCESQNKTLEKLTLTELRSFHKSFDQISLSLLTPDGSVNAKLSPGSTGPKQVAKALAKAQARLEEKKVKVTAIKAVSDKASAILRSDA